MISKTHKTIVYLLLLSITAIPIATAFASISSLNTPLEVATDNHLIDSNVHGQQDYSHHASSHDMDEHAAKASDHCDTNKANCSQCDTCSHCINLADTSYPKSLPSIDQHISPNYSHLYRSVDQTLLLRPPIHS